MGLQTSKIRGKWTQPGSMYVSPVHLPGRGSSSLAGDDGTPLPMHCRCQRQSALLPRLARLGQGPLPQSFCPWNADAIPGKQRARPTVITATTACPGFGSSTREDGMRQPTGIANLDRTTCLFRRIHHDLLGLLRVSGLLKLNRVQVANKVPSLLDSRWHPDVEDMSLSTGSQPLNGCLSPQPEIGCCTSTCG